MKTTFYCKTTLLTGLLTLLTAGASFAQQMNYQGRLTGGAGEPVADAQYSITFDIFDSASGTNKKWGPQVVPADTVQGRFNVILGPTDTNGVNIVTAFDGGTRYLQITFQGNAILPRQQILNAPTAFFAETAGQLANVFVKNGNLGVGTTNPIARMEVVGGASGANGLRIKKAIGNDIAGALHGLQLEVSSGSTRSMGIGVADSGLGVIQVKEVNVGYHDLLLQPIAGNVGIGSATATTTIAGNAAIGGGVAGNNVLRLEKTLGNGAPIDNVHNLQLEIRNGIGAKSMGLGVYDSGTGVIQVKEQGVGYSRLLLNPQADVNASVGIGTYQPSQAKLVVTGTGSSGHHVAPRVYDTGSAGFQFPSAAVFNDISIYASAAVHATTFRAYSDARIKNITGRSDNAADLAILGRVEITDYRYKDVIGKGNRPQKKVVAQQVEKVYPQAVTQSTDVVPDIYQMGSFKNGWVHLKTDLKPGDRVRLISEKQQAVHEVLEVADGRFRTALKTKSDKVFVFGREVKDFRNVDYEAIAMLNVSATQELARQVEALKKSEARVAQLSRQVENLSKSEARVAQLEREMSELRKLVTGRRTSVAAVEATDVIGERVVLSAR